MISGHRGFRTIGEEEASSESFGVVLGLLSETELSEEPHVTLAIEEDGGSVARIQMPQDAARRLGTALLTLANAAVELAKRRELGGAA